MDAEKSARFAILEREVLSAERGGYLSNEDYRAIAELEGHGERPEVDALLERAQAVRERAGKKAHEDSPSFNSSAAHLSSRSAPDNDGL